MKKTLISLAMLGICQVALAAPETYDLDPTHSFANWSIRHVVSKTSGTFNDISGTIVIDENNLASSSVDAVIKMASVNSGHAKRDAHIQKDEYLNAAKFPQMHFVSKKVTAQSQDTMDVVGDFTMNGVTKEITLPVKILGKGKDPWFNVRRGFEAHTIIKASDYGFSWMKKPNAPVGDDIEVTLLIEGIKQ